MDFHDCPHCNTKGVLIMSDGRCPNCKKPIYKDSKFMSTLRKDLPISMDSEKAEPLDNINSRIDNGNVESSSYSIKQAEISDGSLKVEREAHNEQKETETEIKRPPPVKTSESGVNVFRTGNTMVMYRNALLLNRCVKTNATENLKVKKITLRWHHPLIYLTILAGLLTYVIVALICTKKATIEVSVSQRILRKRLVFVLATWACVFLGIFFMGYASVSVSNADNVGLIVLFSVLMFFMAPIVYLIGGRIITASKIDDYYVWIKGVNSEYLSEFPQWQYGYVGVPAVSIPQVVSVAGKKCNQCGNNVLITDKFCWRCGVNLK